MANKGSKRFRLNAEDGKSIMKGLIDVIVALVLALGAKYAGWIDWNSLTPVIVSVLFLVAKTCRRFVLNNS